MTKSRRLVLLVANLLLIGIGIGLGCLAWLCLRAEDAFQDRIAMLDNSQLGTLGYDDLLNVVSILKGVRVGCIFGGVVAIGAGVLNLLLRAKLQKR